MRHLPLLPSLLAILGALPLSAAESGVEKPDAPNTGAKIGQAVGDGVAKALKSLEFGAYGELHYNNFQGSDSHNGQGANSTKRDMIELHRFVLLAEAQLSENIRFVSELEIEHAFIQGKGTSTNATTASEAQGEVELEQCYLDFTYATGHSVRAGMMLVPISIGNLYHEPTVFHGVERPEFDRLVVPTTWFETGASVQGQATSQLGYVLAVQAAPDASKYRSEDGIRNGRERGYKSSADDMMVTGRLDYRPLPGLWLAAAGSYMEGDRDGDVANVDNDVLLYTIEARFKNAGWDGGVSWGQGFIDNAETHVSTSAVPDRFQGFSVYLAYDMLSLITSSDQQVYLFGRYENIDLQAEIPDNATLEEQHQSQIYQIGVTWLITPNVVVKADYRDYDNEAETAVDSWNLGVGFAF
jgi:hypothetical protein